MLRHFSLKKRWQYREISDIGGACSLKDKILDSILDLQIISSLQQI